MENKFYIETSLGCRSGVTLIELLVVLLLGLIVSGVAFSLYRLNSQQYMETEASLAQQRNMREALNSLSRDIRMAGSGMYVLGAGLRVVQAYTPLMTSRTCGTSPIITNSLGWLGSCDVTESGVRAIFGEDGGDTNSDIVTIFRTEPEFTEPVGEIEKFENHVLTLASNVRTGAVQGGDILAMVSGSQAYLMEVDTFTSGREITIKEGPQARFTSPDGLPSQFSIAANVEGLLVYNLKNINLVSYYIDEATSQLMAVYYDQNMNPTDPTDSQAVVVADNIEDFQLYYFFDNEKIDINLVTTDPEISSAKLASHMVQAVSIGLTAKSNFSRRGNQSRPALFNRLAGTVLDSSNRISIMETVQLRNAQ